MTCTLINLKTRERRELPPVTEAVNPVVVLSTLIRPKPRAVGYDPYVLEWHQKRAGLLSGMFDAQKPCDGE